MHITVCCSGGGGNFQYLIDNQRQFKITNLIVDKPCGAIDKAKAAGIHWTISTDPTNVQPHVPEYSDVVVLAGYMPIISKTCCTNLRMINTHPSLLPKYGGKGMYGVKVQEAVIANSEPYAGCSVHWVTPGIDEGKVIIQKRLVVNPGESAWDLGGRIFQMEGPALVEALTQIKARL